ncbi:MAG: hypothetical protein FWD96_07000 [Defluviitaleaceae bacterium]|nr:hypothetical protein [Defluviitaleaceae bacterium]
MKKKLAYIFVNPNTDDKMAEYAVKVLARAVAQSLVSNEDKLMLPSSETVEKGKDR